MKSPLVRFVAATLLWLPATFALWYFAAPLLLWPVQLAVTLIARGAIGDLVQAVESSGATLTFVTTLLPGSGQTGGVVSVDVNMLLYAFGLPLFAALTLAARGDRRWRTLMLGYGVLLPFVAWGTLADFLKNVAITAAPAVVSQAGFSGWQRELIAFAYQFGSLILPAVVPAVVWVLTHRRFLERLRRPEASTGRGSRA
ncbi:MAG TPA: exosortase H-associated membrane protein [Casimicrobiaceae bacterium]